MTKNTLLKIAFGLAALLLAGWAYCLQPRRTAALLVFVQMVYLQDTLGERVSGE